MRLAVTCMFLAALVCEPETQDMQLARLETALRTAVQQALVHFTRETGEPEAFEWDPPEVDGFAPPVPSGGIVFVVRVPAVTERRLRGPGLRIFRGEGVYTRVVQDALVEALCTQFGALAAPDDEWVTVVALAQANRVTSLPTNPRLYLSVKRSDLARIAGERLAPADARQLIVISDSGTRQR